MATRRNTQSTTQTLEAAWHIKGRGKKASYFAKLPRMIGNPGDAIKLVSQAGVITTGKLVEVHETTDDGYECWTFARDTKSPEQMAADRALKLQHNAAYWASDKGAETAQKIRERQEKAANNGEQATTQQAPVQTTTVQAPGGNVVDTTALAVALKAAGFGPLEVAKAILEATGANQPAAVVEVKVTSGETLDHEPATVTPITSKRGPGRPKGSTNKPSVRNTATITGTKTGCVSCGKRTSVLHKHVKANTDGVCTTCMSLPADQVRANAIARMGK
jgi:ribosomal protein L11